MISIQMRWPIPRHVVLVVDVACWHAGLLPWIPRWLVRAIEAYAVWTFRQRLARLFPEDLMSLAVHVPLRAPSSAVASERMAG
jgi:hypothetical protein